MADDSTKSIFKILHLNTINAYCIVLVVLEETRKINTRGGCPGTRGDSTDLVNASFVWFCFHPK